MIHEHQLFSQNMRIKNSNSQNMNLVLLYICDNKTSIIMKYLYGLFFILILLLKTSCEKEVVEETYTITGTVTSVEGDALRNVPIEIYQYDYSVGWDIVSVLVDHSTDYYSDNYDETTTEIGLETKTDSYGRYVFSLRESQLPEKYIIIYNTIDDRNEDYCFADLKFDLHDFESNLLEVDKVLSGSVDCE